MKRGVLKRGVLFREPVGVALETLRQHKMRSFLMLPGIILSVATLIVVISLVSGVNQYIADRVANLGSNVFLLTRFPLITDVEEYVKANRRNKKVTWDDYEALRENLKLPLRVGVELRTDGKVRRGTESITDVNIRGVTANMGDIDPVTPRDGRYISDGDDESRSQVTMIGNDLATKLCPNVGPIGREILIEGRPFQVVGVARVIGTAFGQSQDNFAYIPIQTYLKMYGTQDTIWLNIQARGPEWMARTQDEARAMMRARRHLPPNEPDNFGIFDQASLMELWKNLTGVIAKAISVLMNVPFIAVLIAEAISAAVGIFFGVYPAKKAAGLQPIEALRQEV